MKSTQPSLALIGLHDFLIFSNRMARAWSVEAGNICSVSVFFVRVGSQISPRRAKKDSNIPSPGRKDQSNALPQGQQRQSNPHPMPCPPPLRLYIDRCITNSYNPVRVAKDYKYEKKCSLVHKSGGDGGEECWGVRRQPNRESCLLFSEGTERIANTRLFRVRVNEWKFWYQINIYLTYTVPIKIIAISKYVPLL